MTEQKPESECKGCVHEPVYINVKCLYSEWSPEKEMYVPGKNCKDQHPTWGDEWWKVGKK